MTMPHRVLLRPSEPPYDDDRPAAPAAALVQEALELPAATPPPRLRVLPGGRPDGAPGGSGDARPLPRPPLDPFAPRRTLRGALPPPQPLATRLAVALLEVLAGVRPLQQLVPVAAPSLLADLERRPATPREPVPPGAVRSVHVSEPGDGVAEVCAVVRRRTPRGERYGALAFRLDGLDGRWVLTSLQVG